jgi:hypothetical protein
MMKDTFRAVAPRASAQIAICLCFAEGESGRAHGRGR